MDEMSRTSRAINPDPQQVISLIDDWIKGHTFYDKVMTQLAQYDSNWLLDVLRGLLKSEDQQQKSVAAELLLRLYKKQALQLVLPLLDDADKDVKYCVCYGLSAHGDESASKPLANVLRNDPEASVRHMAAIALQVVGDDSALAALEYAEKFDDGTDNEGRRIRDAASEAIRRIYGRSE